jgi:4-hydroxy-3-polyprenylbenzoate decarboxylase
VVGITDAPGTRFAVRLLEALRSEGVQTHLVVSEAARARLDGEGSGRLEELTGLADHVHQPFNQAARISSGSFLVDGMIVAPCSTATVGGIANGLGSDLLHRAADVTIKEGRPLSLLLVEGRLSPMARDNVRKLASVPGVRVLRPVPAAEGAEVTTDGHSLDLTVGLLMRSVGLGRDRAERLRDVAGS